MSSEYLLIQKIKDYNTNSNTALIVKAIDYSKKAHISQYRASGEAYFSHPLAVANILADLKLDDATIITGLLHDTVEDTIVTKENIEQEFGFEIAKLVDGVTKLSEIEFQPENIRQAENFRKLLLAMSEDIRILLVKISDRLHNMRTISHIKSRDKRIRISRETLEIYAPLTARIGIHYIKEELQDIAFEQLNHDVRDSIINRLEFLKIKGEKNIIKKVIYDLDKLLSSKNIKCEITGRVKRPYSIWEKMKKKNISFEQLSDIMAFRIILDNIDQCYKVLGIIHYAYHSVPGTFKDYISTPKDNGYRSLHTIIIGPDKKKIELQIRTNKMHEIAEYGIAAHWSYKVGAGIEQKKENYRWVKDLLAILDNSSDKDDFVKNSRLEMFHDQVFCFSPKGDLVALPNGSTPIDFAYAIHSDIGNNCVGVKINGLIAPLRSILHNGDQVDVICSENSEPSDAWADFVITGKAKTQIKRHIRLKKKDILLKLGKNSLYKYVHDNKCELSEQKLRNIIHLFSRSNLDDFYMAVGEGLIDKGDVFKAVFPEYGNVKKSRILGFFNKKRKKRKSKILDNIDIAVDGLIPGMQSSFANCCHPIPGDKIIGIVCEGEGITIHMSKCNNLKDDPNNNLKLSWNYVKDSEELYVVRLRVSASNEFGIIAQVAELITRRNINILNINIGNKSNAYYEIFLDLEVNNLNHLQNLQAYLRSIKNIYSVDRVIN